MTPRQSCAKRSADWSGLEESETLTGEPVTHATNFAAKDLSNHCCGPGQETLELGKWETDARVKPVGYRGGIQI